MYLHGRWLSSVRESTSRSLNVGGEKAVRNWFLLPLYHPTQLKLTSKVRPIAQLGFRVAAGQHTDSSMLDEIHLPSNCALADYEV